MQPVSDAMRYLLDATQRDFPLQKYPFRELAQRLNDSRPAPARRWTPGNIIHQLAAAQTRGALSRLGPVFAAHGIGCSTLAALRVPEHRLHAVAAAVSALPQVNHNYRRSHDFNLWFVVTGRDASDVQQTLQHIQTIAPDLSMLDLPLEDAYYIDLGFALDEQAAKPHCTAARAERRHLLTAQEWALVSLVQNGLPLTERPYAVLAQQWQHDEQTVIDTLSRWLDVGIVRRLGCVLRHRKLGFRANAMCVFDIPDEHVGQIGHALAGAPEVRLCYRRRRAGPDWPYNLFCMVHGAEATRVQSCITQMVVRLGLAGFPRAVLFGEHCYKQRGAWYVAPVASRPSTPEWVSTNTSSSYRLEESATS